MPMSPAPGAPSDARYLLTESNAALPRAVVHTDYWITDKRWAGGAVLDGITDNTAVIQAIVNAIVLSGTGGRIRFPGAVAGICRIAGRINMQTQAVFDGVIVYQGDGTSLLFCDAAGLRIFDARAQWNHFAIEGLLFLGPSPTVAAPTAAMNIVDSQATTFTIRNCRGFGVKTSSYAFQALSMLCDDDRFYGCASATSWFNFIHSGTRGHMELTHCRDFGNLNGVFYSQLFDGASWVVGTGVAAFSEAETYPQTFTARRCSFDEGAATFEFSGSGWDRIHLQHVNAVTPTSFGGFFFRHTKWQKITVEDCLVDARTYAGPGAPAVLAGGWTAMFSATDGTGDVFWKRNVTRRYYSGGDFASLPHPTTIVLLGTCRSFHNESSELDVLAVNTSIGASALPPSCTWTGPQGAGVYVTAETDMAPGTLCSRSQRTYAVARKTPAGTHGSKVEGVAAEQAYLGFPFRMHTRVGENVSVLTDTFGCLMGESLSVSETVDGAATPIQNASISNVQIAVATGGAAPSTLAGATWDKCPPPVVDPPFVADSFNRTNNALGIGTPDVGPDWVNRIGVMGITANTAYAVSVAGGLAIATLDCGLIAPHQNNILVQARIPTFDDNPFLVYRYVDANNYSFLALSLASFAWELVKVTGGVSAILASGNNAPPTAGQLVQVYLLSLAGGMGLVRYMKDNLAVGEGTDAAPAASSHHGIGASGAGALNVRWDDFLVRPIP